MEESVDEHSEQRTGPGTDVPVVALTGEIDLAVAPSLQKRLNLLLSRGSTTIVVDLLGATFLDSIALGVLVSTMDECRKAGGDLHLVVTEPRILKVLKITGLADTFTIHSTRQGSSDVQHSDGEEGQS
jgi:anti-sigma B factor antagonist